MKKSTLTVSIVVVFIGVVLAFWLFNECAAQIISTLFVLGVSAVVLARNIEKPGMRTILLAAEPVFLALCRPLAETKFAAYFSGLCNAAIGAVYARAGIENSVNVGNETAIITLFWILFAIAVVILSKHDHTAMGIHQGAGDSEFREKNYHEKSEAFCKVLRQRLETLNRETDWNDSLFTPIEAEVEVNAKGKRKKKYADLLKCLKKTRRGADVFLVLGDPGAGKSVSLRKLCLELLDEAKKTKKIPVYINLKKWNKNWGLDQLPHKSDLTDFVKETLYENGDILTDGFLNSYFEKMLEDGRWYFVFDSFDEMPCLMGKQNCQELIDHISELLYQFLTGKNQSGGIIASRLYKAPSEAMRPTTVLRIQEFNDIKIRTMLDKYLNCSKEVINELFGKREDLVVLCRNPFYLTLLINFVMEKGMSFPKNQMDLYSNFVESRLQKCAGKLENEHCSKEDVHCAAKQLAVFFQESAKYGLECPARELYRQSGGAGQEYWQKTLRILEYAKICRFGGLDETVSFVHRRFQEFFLVESIIERGQRIGEDEYRSIVYGSGMRDALVLYCEVAKEDNAREIAAYCWKVLQKNISHRKSVLGRGGVSLVNILEFMTEAFRNRKSAMSDFMEQFEKLVTKNLDEHTDFVILFALTNSMVLFNQDYLQKAVLRVFQLKNRWLNDTVMQNCRLIHRLNHHVETKFCNYFFSMDIRTFLRRYRNTHFSLSISKSFRYIRLVHSCILLRYAALIVSAGLFMAVAFARLIGMLGGGVQQLVGTEQVFTGSNTGISMLLYIALGFSAAFNDSVMWQKDHSKGLMKLLILPIRRLLPSMIIGIAWSVVVSAINSFVVYVWLIVFIIVFLAGQFLTVVHNLYYELKGIGLKIVKPVAFAFAGVAVVIIVMLTVCWVIERYFRELFEMFFTVVIIAAGVATGLAVVVFLIVYLIYYWKDRNWVKRQPRIQRIDRAKLANKLNVLHFAKWKSTYVEQLLQNKVSLEGTWPNGYRPGKKDDNDDLERLLAKLDCISLELYSCIF